MVLQYSRLWFRTRKEFMRPQTQCFFSHLAVIFFIFTKQLLSRERLDLKNIAILRGIL